jgi:hypothetical protein
MNSRTGTKVIAVMILFIASLTTNAQTSNSILGKWKDADHPEKQIEISSQNGKYYGKSINASKPNENGKTVLKDLIWQQEDVVEL